MREAVFLRNNEKKWLSIEKKINDSYNFTTEEIVHYFCFKNGTFCQEVGAIESTQSGRERVNQ